MQNETMDISTTLTQPPTYADLQARVDAPPGSSWGLFGANDERGMANFAGAQQILESTHGVSRGVAFSLDYPVDAFNPPVALHRSSMRHHLTATHADQRDDYVDGFWLQSSSQIDGLRHRRHHRYGFYNGVPDDAIVAGSPTLGVQRWKEQPIIGRGVIVDIGRFRAERGLDVDHASGEGLSVREIEEAMAWQGVSLQRGDCLLLRTGWSNWYLNLSKADQAEVRTRKRYTGLVGTRETISWLWDHHLALFASDTMAGEVLPASGDITFGGPNEPGMIHQDLIALLGLPVGELWNLEEVARDSSLHGEYACFLSVSPLHIPGGVGSPANAVAIR